jgi:hypothetical protein
VNRLSYVAFAVGASASNVLSEVEAFDKTLGSLGFFLVWRGKRSEECFLLL